MALNWDLVGKDEAREALRRIAEAAHRAAEATQRLADVTRELGDEMNGD